MDLPVPQISTELVILADTLMCHFTYTCCLGVLSATVQTNSKIAHCTNNGLKKIWIIFSQKKRNVCQNNFLFKTLPPDSKSAESYWNMKVYFVFLKLSLSYVVFDFCVVYNINNVFLKVSIKYWNAVFIRFHVSVSLDYVNYIMWNYMDKLQGEVIAPTKSVLPHFCRLQQLEIKKWRNAIKDPLKLF
jgi:hypothetical protein